MKKEFKVFLEHKTIEGEEKTHSTTTAYLFHDSEDGFSALGGYPGKLDALNYLRAKMITRHKRELKYIEGMIEDLRLIVGDKFDEILYNGEKPHGAE